MPIVKGVGPNTAVIVNDAGGEQSHSPYRADLLPPLALLHEAEILAYGARKYGDNNWRRIALADHVNHALVHLLAHQAGDKQDDHLGHACCRLLFALETQLVQEKTGEDAKA